MHLKVHIINRMEERERDIYKLVQAREKSRNLGNIRCIKGADNRTREDEIKGRWEKYFQKLYNENLVRGVGLDDTYLYRDILCCRRITGSDIKNAKKYENRKVGRA